MWRWCKMTMLGCSLMLGILTAGNTAAASVSDNSVVNNVAVKQAIAEDIASPYELIKNVTEEVLAKIDSHRGRLEAGGSDAERERHLNSFFDQIDATLTKVVDFEWIARNVMGPYGKSATPAQRASFAETFHSGLVQTYGRGLLSYSNQEIIVLPGSDDYTSKRKVSVRQEIRSTEGNYPLEYSMGLNKMGQWRVINVVINGINLGKTFRNQFVQAAQKNGGDIDAVIATWDSKAG